MADVLIADNSEFMRDLLGAVLGEEHSVVRAVENGVEAVEVYRKMQPDLVLMEIDMPIQDGIEATAAITDEDPAATIVICTSVTDPERREAAMDAGADAYVTKPYQKQGVLAALDHAISG